MYNQKPNPVRFEFSYPTLFMDCGVNWRGGSATNLTFEANSTYWQVKIPKTPREKTGFTIQLRFFHFTGITFKLESAPETPQQAMDALLGDVRWQFAFVHFHNMVIFSYTLDKHIDHDRQVLIIIIDAGVILNLNRKECFQITWITFPMYFTLNVSRFHSVQLLSTRNQASNRPGGLSIMFWSVQSLFPVCTKIYLVLLHC